MELSQANSRREQIAMALLAKRQEAVNAQNHVGGDRTPLICIDFEYLSGKLAADQPVFCFLSLTVFPNRLSTVTDVARHFVSQLREIRPNGPYHLCGYCFGAVIALEMARLLNADGQQIEQLVLMEPPTHPGAYLSPAFRAIRRLRLSWLRPREGLRYVLSMIPSKKSSGVANPAEGLLDISSYVAAMDQAILDYAFPPYPGTATLLVGKDSTRRYIHEARWRNIIESGFELRLISGNHGDRFLSEELVTFFRQFVNS